MKKKHHIARRYRNRKRPPHLGAVSFEPVCCVCKKPINDKPCCEEKK